MTTTYTRQQATATERLSRLGAPVTFSRQAGTYAFTTARTTPAAAVTGASSAVRKKGNPARYLLIQQSAAMVLEDPVTLLVAAQPLGSFVPQAGDQVVFAGITRTVRDRVDVAPDGTAITYDIVASR